MNSHDRGSASLELVVIAPALLLLAALIVGAGRVALAGQTVQTAAAQAARDATLARTASAGATAARDTARRVLARQGLECAPDTIDVDARDLGLPIGRRGAVSVVVTCRVELSDVGLPGLPGSRTLHASATMPTDPWTAR
jgi:TadE-like protein